MDIDSDESKRDSASAEQEEEHCEEIECESRHNTCIHPSTVVIQVFQCSSSIQPRSPTASKSDDEQSKFYTPFYNDRIKQDLHIQSQSLKPKCKEKKVEIGTLQELCYIHLGNTEIC
jgi:hypothetical protein